MPINAAEAAGALGVTLVVLALGLVYTVQAVIAYVR